MGTKNNLLFHPTILLIIGTIPLILGGLFPDPNLSYITWGGYKFNSVPLFFILLCIIAFEFGVLITAKYSLHIETAKNITIAKLILLFSFMSLFLYIGRILYFLGDMRNIFNHAVLYHAKDMAILTGITTLYHAITGPILFFFWLSIEKKDKRYKKILIGSLIISFLSLFIISERGTIFDTLVAIVIFYYLVIGKDKIRIGKKNYSNIIFGLILILFVLFSYIQKFRIAPNSDMSFLEVMKLGINQILFYGTINYRNLDVVMQHMEQPLAILKLVSGVFGIKTSYIENLYVNLIRGGAGTFSAYGDLFLDFSYGSVVVWMFQGIIMGLLYRSNDIAAKAIYAFLSSLLLQSFMISFYYSRVVISLLSIIFCFHPLVRRN